MKIFDPKNYVRLFRFTNVPLLLDFFYLERKKDKRILAINANNQRTLYIPKDEFEKTLNEGVEIYGTKESASKFESEMKKAAAEFLGLSKNLQEKIISKKDMHDIDEAFAKFYGYYDKTDFFYTDRASEKGLVQNNLPHFGKLKEDMRRVINEILFGENALIYSILKSIAEKFDIDYDKLLFYTPEELDMVFDGQKFDDSVCLERKNFYAVYSEDDLLFLHDNPKEIARIFSSNDENVIKGVVASKGFAKGRAIIFPDNVTSFSDLRKAMDRMEKGDVLVAETTSPEIMPACSKAAAIVTNQGGLMSHAAIVSRELNIPCIVGTENATTILKDGDLVEVDAEKGVVRILEK
ncbi:MAG TPA: hypothetical protein DIC35_01895 [Candidatus Moranbacteria bacterium]|nr:hypothetical protein [Candidatus Moranbacteria bacterium]